MCFLLQNLDFFFFFYFFLFCNLYTFIVLKHGKSLKTFSMLQYYESVYVVTCECNSSYSFIPLLLKLYRCFNHGLLNAHKTGDQEVVVSTPAGSATFFHGD